MISPPASPELALAGKCSEFSVQGSGKDISEKCSEFRKRRDAARRIDRLTYKAGGNVVKTYMDVEDLEVYKRLCKLHIEVCDLSHEWPQEERYELGSQVRRSSNSSPAQLAEKHDDRHIRNKIEGINRSRGEAGETIHHLFIAKLKGYIEPSVYSSYRSRYKECIRMLNGLEKSLEKQLPDSERRWTAQGESSLSADLPGFRQAES